MEIRKKSKELEMVWRGSHSFGRQNDVFTSNIASGRGPYKEHSQIGHSDAMASGSRKDSRVRCGNAQIS